jgi:WD40 repeat protein
VSASKRAAKSLAPTAPGVGCFWLNEVPVFAFGDGTLLVNSKKHTPHDGGIVSIANSASGNRVLTAGEDGRIVSTDEAGASSLVFDRQGAWLDTLLPHPNGKAVAVCCGRDVLLLDTQTPNSIIATFKPARPPNSLAFSGDGSRLAIGHSGGVSLFETAVSSAPEYELPCSGGPISVALDPSGSFLFAGLAEPALAGWRLTDGQGFRMGGYPGKPKQLVFQTDGKALLTSGGPALLVWPMVGKDGIKLSGPMGQAAGVYRPRLGLATAIACYGSKAVVGWSDGGVDLVDLITGNPRHLGGPRPQTQLNTDPRALTTAIIAVSFREDGKQVAWMGEQGAYGNAAIA